MIKKSPPVEFTANADLSSITFSGFDLPTISAGNYVFSLSQKFDIDGNPPWEKTHEIVVDAPRYKLMDDAIIFRSPANAAVGDFETFLPSVVLNDPKLPWARKATPPGYPDATPAPWLQLMQLSAEELPLPQTGQQGILAVDPLSHSASLSIPDFKALLGKKASTIGLENTGNLVVPQFSSANSLVDEATAACTMIAVPAVVVAASFPKWQEMPYLTQIRTQSDKVRHSVIVANRFSPPVTGPQSFKRMLHLISVENYWALLDGSAAGKVALDAHVAADDVICFLVMDSWTFQDGGAGVRKDHFGPLAFNLVEDTTSKQMRDISFVHEVARSEFPAGMEKVQARFNSGYAPKKLKMPTEENSFAWYRGPFVPFDTPSFDPANPIVPAMDQFSDAMVYARDEGVFDLSLSAAWQIGRVLSMADINLMTIWAAILKHLRTVVDGEMMSRRLDIRPKSNATESFLEILHETGVQTKRTHGFSKRTKRKRKGSHKYPTQREFRLAVSSLSSDALWDAIPQEQSDVLVEKIAGFLRFQGIPFHLLVPDSSYLDVERIKAFNVDPQWLMALMDGALSLAFRAGTDDALYQELRDRIWEEAVKKVNIQFSNKSATSVDLGAPFTASGVILRSHIVDAWDDLTATAFTVDTGTGALSPLPVWREMKLAGSIRIWLYLGRPDVFVLAPPVGRLHLGVTENKKIQLRNLDLSLGPIGKTISTAPPPPTSIDITVYLRADKFTLNLWDESGAGLALKIATDLKALAQPYVDPTLPVPIPPQALAVQLLVGTPSLDIHNSAVTSLRDALSKKKQEGGKDD